MHLRRGLWWIQGTPFAYSGPLRANTVLCSFSTIQPSSSFYHVHYDCTKRCPKKRYHSNYAHTTLLNVDRLSKFHRKTVVKASDYDNIRFVITGLVCGIDKYQSTVLNRLLVTRTLTDVIAVTRYSDILKVVMGSLIISSLLIHRQVCR